MRRQGNDIKLGQIEDSASSLLFSHTERDKHLYVCGGTGMGKTKFLEHAIRQDIIAWRKSKCGVVVIDSHGSLYDSLITWLTWNKIDRPIIPVDFRQDEWVVAYNLLRQRPGDPAVLVDNVTDAMAYVWGQTGTNQTPLFARWVSNVLRALYEKNLTLVESQYLIDHVAKQVRYAITSDLAHKPARQDWAFADTLNTRDFENQIGSTVNRLKRFLENEALQCVFGQPKISLDLGKVIEEGSILLVNLSTERSRISVENAKLFGTLLLTDLWAAAHDRGKPSGTRPKPTYVYIDEFQQFVTPTIAENFDEARGYGLHLTVAHQFPLQLPDQGESGRRVLNSVMENASSKVSFRLSAEENLKMMAQWLFRGVMNPDQIKHELFGTKVMRYVEEMREISSHSRSTSSATGKQAGYASGQGIGGTVGYFDGQETLATSESDSNFSAVSGSESNSSSESFSESRSEVPMLIPIMGKELTQVQFRSLEEQLFKAMAVLFDQEERHGVARLVGMKAPLSIGTPNIQRLPSRPEEVQRYLEGCYEKLPFALKGTDAKAQIKSVADNFVAELLLKAADEPIAAKRKINKTSKLAAK